MSAHTYILDIIKNLIRYNNKIIFRNKETRTLSFFIKSETLLPVELCFLIKKFRINNLLIVITELPRFERGNSSPKEDVLPLDYN